MALPTNVGTGFVQGLFLRGIIDGPDIDQEPEGIPIPDLTITFTPGITPALVRDISSSPPATIFIDPVIAITNNDGYLTTPTQPELLGVKLIASADPDLTPNGWTWNVRITGENFPVITFSFIMPVNGNIDLTTVLPVPPNPGEDVANWQQAVNAAMEAQARAESALALAQEIFEGVVFIGAPSTYEGEVILAEKGAVSDDPGNPNAVVIDTEDDVYRVARLGSDGRLSVDVLPTYLTPDGIRALVLTNTPIDGGGPSTVYGEDDLGLDGGGV